MTEILQIDIDAAQRRAERIRFHATNANEAMQSLQKLVHTARELDDHVTLGYQSWTAYVRDLFGDEPLRLARDVRRELVAELADAGMSTRAIAPIVGVSHMQVANDVREQGVKNFTPEPAPVESEGFTVNPTTGEVIDPPAEPVATEHTVTEKIKTVTGLDGKEYTRPEPRAPKPHTSGDAAIQHTAEQACLDIVRGISALARFEHENQRNVILNDWWPRSLDAIMPAYQERFTASNIRTVAAGLNKLAQDMENHNDYQ